MTVVEQVKESLQSGANPAKAQFFPSFFKTGPGEYGEGDQFIGVVVPEQRKVAVRFYKEATLADIRALLTDPIHEYRLTALFMLVERYNKAKSETEQKEIVDFYLQHTAHINNWDLVDSSAEKILGAYLFHHDKSILYTLAASNSLWEQRIAVIATFYFIKQGEFDETLKLAKLLLKHPHDLMHKAIGWMLREIGKRSFKVEYAFLQEHYTQMPRTMLRYAIEKFPEEQRLQFLKGQIE